MSMQTKPQPGRLGSGSFRPPPFSTEDLAAIRQRADAIQDQQVKTDVFRLVAEVERLCAEVSRG